MPNFTLQNLRSIVREVSGKRFPRQSAMQTALPYPDIPFKNFS